MRSIALCMAAALGLIALTGCGASRSATISASGAVTIPPGAVTGSADWLRDVSTLETTALVTIYDANGTGHVSAQRATIDVDAGKIEATCNVPGGSWWARASLDGWGVFNPIGWDAVRTRGDAELTDAQEDAIVETLRLIVHRVRGPINLFGGGERVVGVESMPTGAHRTTRMLAEGRPSLAAAYFFAIDGGQLRMITRGEYEPGEVGTVTTYITERAAEGVVIPTRMDVVRLGIDSLKGQRKVLSVRLTDVKLR